jgi:RNA polymerase sigma factor (sigma-70 family)
MASLHAVGPIKAFCDVHGLNLSLVYDLLNLRKGPLIRRGSRGNVYALRPICARLASLLERDADWLFPASLYNITWPTKLVAEVAHEQAISLIAAPHEMLMLPATQESDQIRRELRDGLRGVLATLTPRQQQVIRLRFGLDDGVERTYAAIGAALALTHESIRQIETKALYKLRGPRRTRQLRPWYEE